MLHKIFHFFTRSIAIVTILLLYGCNVPQSEQAATHPSLTDIRTSDLVPIKDILFKAGAGREFEVSPQGKWVSWKAFDDQQRFVFAYRLRSGAKQSFTLYSTEPARFFWGKFDRYIYVTMQGRLYRFEADDPQAPHQDVTPRGFNHWKIGWRPAVFDDPWKIVSSDRNPAFVDVFSVLPDGSEKQLIFKNSGTELDWQLDYKGQFFWRTVREANNVTRHEFPKVISKDLNSIDWNTSLRTGPEERLFVQNGGVTEYGSVLALSDRGRDKLALVYLDPNTGNERVIAEDSKSDISAVFYSDIEHQIPSLVWFAEGYLRPQALNGWGRNFLELLGDDNQETVGAQIISHSSNHRYLIVKISHNKAGSQYYLFDMVSMERELVGHSPLSLSDMQLSTSKPILIEATDGLKLPSILTLPAGVEPKKLPLVLLVHGGPAQHDRLFSSYELQFYGNRGYAVLQVNYRGSTGFGKKFQKAGHLQFGRGMQSDLVDAAKWAIDEGIADPDAIAVVGASFGGYSSLMALAQDGDMFAAGISAFGPTDLHYQTRNNPHSWQLFGHTWKRYFGDPSVPENVKFMNEYSPVNLVNSIKKPVLIVHGKRDGIVGVEQSEKLAKLLTANGNTPETLYFEHEAHGIVRYKSLHDYFRKVEVFLAEHLGGGKLPLPESE